MVLRTSCCLALFLALFLTFAAPAQTQSSSGSSSFFNPDSSILDDLRQYSGLLRRNMGAGQQVAAKAAELTGTAISPLLGLCMVGWLDIIRLPKRELGRLPWYKSPPFLLFVTLVLCAITFKDTFGEILGPFKIPLDQLDAIQHQAASILAFVVVLPGFVDALAGSLQGPLDTAARELGPCCLAYAAEAGAGLAAQSPGYLAQFLAAVLGTAVFATVWLASSTVNMLLCIAPFPFLGLLLKSLRTALFGLLFFLTAVHPYVGLAVSVLVLYLSYRLAGWSFRLLLFGLVLCLDSLLLRWKWTRPSRKGIRAFGAGLPGVRVRTMGRLRVKEGSVIFRYRPWLIFPSREFSLPVQTRCRPARGALMPSIVEIDEHNRRALVLLPPRYRRHEAEVANVLGIPAIVQDAGLVRGLRAVMRWMGGGPDTKATSSQAPSRAG